MFEIQLFHILKKTRFPLMGTFGHLQILTHLSMQH
jgi:hypothetical protein